MEGPFERLVRVIPDARNARGKNQASVLYVTLDSGQAFGLPE